MSGEPDADKTRNTTSVGGVVVGPEGILLMRMTYGPTKGRFMLPGGLVNPGKRWTPRSCGRLRRKPGL